jgi:hypothetical protein
MTDVRKTEYEEIPWSKFLESKPPGVFAKVPDLVKVSGAGPSWVVSHPELQLYCSTESCQGIRFFNPSEEEFCPGINRFYDYLLNYTCRNCQRSSKTYALRILVTDRSEPAMAAKVGEFPPFGPPTPARVISLIGPDRDIFLKGRRAENQGLGIGAFSYYRRVIENQKSRIIQEVAKVAQRLGAKESALEVFQLAILETQFSKAVEQIKQAIPESLLIDGHNPLTLLHDALSEGLHAQTDEECLEIATSIRIVMTELADRISTALKDQAELKEAVTRLLNRKNSRIDGDSQCV